MDDLKFIGSSLGIDVGLSALILFNALFLLMHDKQSVTGSCLLPSGWLLTLEGLAQLATLLQIFHLTSTRSQCDGNYILFCNTERRSPAYLLFSDGGVKSFTFHVSQVDTRVLFSLTIMFQSNSKILDNHERHSMPFFNMFRYARWGVHLDCLGYPEFAPHAFYSWLPRGTFKDGDGNTLYQQRSCVNIIPLYLFKKLNIGLLEETGYIFGLADETKSYPVGIVKDVEVHIGKLKLLNDFYVIDMKKDPETPLLVGRGFLATTNAVIDCRMAKIAVGEGITRSVFDVKGVDFGKEEAPYWTTLGKRESYKPRPSSDGIGAQTPYYARKDFLDCHLPGE
ncbi:MAK10-like protein [Tanacetum coccineum]